MTKTILNIKTEPSTKKQIQEFASELGVPVSVIINAQIKQMLRDRRVILSTELEPAPYLVKIMEQVEKEWKGYHSITADTDLRLHFRMLDDDTALFVAAGSHYVLYKHKNFGGDGWTRTSDQSVMSRLL